MRRITLPRSGLSLRPNGGQVILESHQIASANPIAIARAAQGTTTQSQRCVPRDFSNIRHLSQNPAA